MNITMKNNLSEYNAKIGSEFDKQAAKLKTKNLKYTYSYIGFLASGAVFADLGGIIDSKISFSIAFGSTLLSLIIYRKKKRQNLTEQWTYTRVIAETFKSEWFKFVVGGGDYPKKVDIDENEYKEAYKRKLREFYDEYKEAIHGLGGDYINNIDINLDEESLQIRKEGLQERLRYYQKNRMEDQKKWYEQRSKDMRTIHENYNRFFSFVLGVGVLIGFFMILDALNQIQIPAIFKENDFFSIFIALGFTLDAINSARQYERLGIAYTKSFNELSDAIREIDDVHNDIRTDEEVFNDFVEDIEDKISSEHKSWSLTTSSKNIH